MMGKMKIQKRKSVLILFFFLIFISFFIFPIHKDKNSQNEFNQIHPKTVEIQNSPLSSNFVNSIQIYSNDILNTSNSPDIVINSTIDIVYNINISQIFDYFILVNGSLHDWGFISSNTTTIHFYFVPNNTGINNISLYLRNTENYLNISDNIENFTIYLNILPDLGLDNLNPSLKYYLITIGLGSGIVISFSFSKIMRFKYKSIVNKYINSTSADPGIQILFHKDYTLNIKQMAMIVRNLKKLPYEDCSINKLDEKIFLKSVKRKY